MGADLGPIRSGPHDPRDCSERPPAISTAGGRGRLVDVHGRPVIVRGTRHLHVLVSEGDGVDPPVPNEDRCQPGDDIADGGAEHFAQTIRAIRRQ